MIRWIKYDESNPPQLYKEYLVYTKSGICKVAELEKSFEDELDWIEPQECLNVHGVTHYAEINLPAELFEPTEQPSDSGSRISELEAYGSDCRNGSCNN